MAHTAAILGLTELFKAVFMFVLTYVLSTREYGLYGLVAATISIGSAIFDGGFSSYLRREVGATHEARRRQIFTTSFTAQIGVLVLFFAVLIAFPFSRSHFMVLRRLNQPEIILMWLLFACSVLTPTIVSYLNYTKRIEVANNVTFVRAFSWLGFVLALSLIKHVTLTDVLWSWVTSYLLSFLLAFKKINFIPFGKVDWGILRAAAFYGIPLYLSDLFLICLYYLDRFFLTALASSAIVGIYHFSNSFISSFDRLNVKTWKGVLFPYIFEAHDRNHFPRRNELITLMVKLHFFLMLAFMGFVVVGLRTFLPHLLPHAYVEHQWIFILISLVPLTIVLSYPASIALLLQKRTGRVAVSHGIGFAVSVVLNFILIPRLSLYGSVLAMIAGFSVIGVLKYLFSKGWEYVDFKQFFSVDRELRMIRNILKKGITRKGIIDIFDDASEVYAASS